MLYQGNVGLKLPSGSGTIAADFTSIPCFLHRSSKALNNCSRSDCIRSARTYGINWKSV